MKKVLYLSLSFKKDIIIHNLLNQYFADLGVYYVCKFPSFPQDVYAILKSKEIKNFDYIIFDTDIKNGEIYIEYNYSNSLFKEGEPHNLYLDDLINDLNFPNSYVICDCANSTSDKMTYAFSKVSKGYIGMDKKISQLDNTIFIMKLFDYIIKDNLHIMQALTRLKDQFKIANVYNYYQGVCDENK